MSRIAWCALVLATTGVLVAACDKSDTPGAASSDPVVARLIVAERTACACKTLACATAADRELSAWVDVYREDVARAVADPTREAQIDLHRGRADACRRALEERATGAELAAIEPEGGADAAIRLMGKLADKLCLCRDMKCAEAVMREMSSMKEPSGKPSKAEMESAMKIAEKMAECQKRLMDADMPSSD